MKMNEREAFQAMYAFLCEVYERTESDALGALLGSMSFLPDGAPADPGLWMDWLKCVRQALKKEVDSDIKIV